MPSISRIQPRIRTSMHVHTFNDSIEGKGNVMDERDDGIKRSANRRIAGRVACKREHSKRVVGRGGRKGEEKTGR